ncbi:hypothetical protein A3F66_03295 [candidate division TM6 bacterium RIFCSPHIGHO2_12_FULL_32_22]|nr:MAG: hypothetical protein A3F66_03295 [candidate division TM6 bacterium RIFCSPHIGHO2_12_FULL_32_22]
MKYKLIFLLNLSFFAQSMDELRQLIEECKRTRVLALELKKEAAILILRSNNLSKRCASLHQDASQLQQDLEDISQKHNSMQEQSQIIYNCFKNG